MKVMQSATCAAFFCRCKMPHDYSEVMVGKMINIRDIVQKAPWCPLRRDIFGWIVVK